MLQIAVCGQGSIAHSIAAVCGWRGHAVRVLASQSDRWADRIAGRLPDGTLFAGALDAVTDDPRAALANADLAFICVPHASLPDMLRTIAPHVGPSVLVGAIPGFGGFGLMARRTMPAVACFFGTQRIPFVVGGHEPGRSVAISGIRRQTFVGTIPATRARPVAELLHRLLGVPTVPTSHFANIELSPSNSVVNPARLYSLFGPPASRAPRGDEEFFLDWNMAASKTLLAIDRELQEGRRRIPRDTSFVMPVLVQYDANDARTLTHRFRHLRTLAGRRIPARRVRGRLVADERSDYVREDIDHGLRLVRDLLRLAGAETLVMDEILSWRHSLAASRGFNQLNNYPVSYFATIGDLATAMD